MTDKKHFSYQGDKPVVVTSQPIDMQDDPIVEDVEFLTPAKLIIRQNHQQVFKLVNIDIINRKVYDEHGETNLSEKVFAHLDSVNSLPEDFFAAPDDIVNQAAGADAEGERLRKTYVRGNDE